MHKLLNCNAFIAFFVAGDLSNRCKQGCGSGSWKRWKQCFLCGSGSRSATTLPFPPSHRLFDLKSNLAKKFCPFSDVGEVLLLLPDPLRGMGHGEGPWSPRNWATHKGPDQRSYRDRESPKSSSAASFLERNECPGTHCRVIE